MRLNKILLLVGVAVMAGGLALPDDAFARGGGGGGGRGGGGGGGGAGGAGRGGGGRGTGRGGRGKKGDGSQMDRPSLIEKAEEDAHTADRESRFQSGRKATFDEVQRAKREEVLTRHRRMGEDSRRQQDSRIEVAR